MLNYDCMKTYSLDEAQKIVNKKIKESVAKLRHELRAAKKTSSNIKTRARKAYVSRSV